jgi:hypothetical protein
LKGASTEWPGRLHPLAPIVAARSFVGTTHRCKQITHATFRSKFRSRSSILRLAHSIAWLTIGPLQARSSRCSEACPIADAAHLPAGSTFIDHPRLHPGSSPHFAHLLTVPTHLSFCLSTCKRHRRQWPYVRPI